MYEQNTITCSCYKSLERYKDGKGSANIDPFEAFITFPIHFEIRRIDLQEWEYSWLVPGLRNSIVPDFHFMGDTANEMQESSMQIKQIVIIFS